MLALIVAHDEKRVIGKDGWMPWHLPQDLAHFKRITMGHDILLGRTTFAAMGKPLPKRHTFVATTNPDYAYDHEHVTIVHDLDAFLRERACSSDILYVCGGAKIYAQALPYASELWISLVEGEHAGDTFFPDYSIKDYMLISKEGKEGFQILHYRKK